MRWIVYSTADPEISLHRALMNGHAAAAAAGCFGYILYLQTKLLLSLLLFSIGKRQPRDTAHSLTHTVTHIKTSTTTGSFLRTPGAITAPPSSPSAAPYGRFAHCTGRQGRPGAVVVKGEGLVGTKIHYSI